MSRSPRGAILLGAVGMLLCAAPAGAIPLVQSSQITTPAASPTYLTYNPAGQTTFAVSGVVTSNLPIATVDLRCYSGDQGSSTLIASNLTVNSDGTFSDPAAPLAGLSGPCRLRAVPSGVTDNTPAFNGPLLVVDTFQDSTLSGPPNNGVEFDYSIGAGQLGVVDNIDSVGACGFGGDLLDGAFGIATRVFSCAGELGDGNLDGQGNTRSEVQIDGANAYAPAAAEVAFSDADEVPGLPSLTASMAQNPTTGAVTVTDSEPFAGCPAGTPYPPTFATCTSFDPTGVLLTRTITQTGHLVTITDSYASTDGRSHSIDLLYQNGVNLSATSTGYEAATGYEFPGQSTYAAHAQGGTVSVPSGPGTILIKNLVAGDGDPYTGQAAITYDTAPSQFLFISPPSFGTTDFTAHYAATVPASGTLRYRFVYAQDFTTAAVTAEADGAEDAFVSPTVHISIPRNDQVTHSVLSEVTGTATDLVGISSLTVDKRAVTVNADGSWSTEVSLRKGKNTFTVVATNRAGQTSTASVEITYTPYVCKVPKLARKSLPAAKTALKLAHCAVGRTTRKHSANVGVGGVISSSPKAGSSHKAGTKVALTVSSGP
jgi:hypothetical protein